MGEEKKPQSLGVWPTVKPFVNGGASGMLATCVIQPIDMIKVQTCVSLDFGGLWLIILCFCALCDMKFESFLAKMAF
jgi:hypothetical protein